MYDVSLVPCMINALRVRQRCLEVKSLPRTDPAVRSATCIIQSSLANKVRLSLQLVAAIGMLLNWSVRVGVCRRADC